MKARTLAALCTLLVLGVVVVFSSAADAMDIEGEMEVAAWARFRIPHGGTWRTRLNVVAEEMLDPVRLRVHGRLDARDGDAAATELREATVSLQTEDVHWTAGRQVITWGSGILFQPTSLVNPSRWVDGELERVPVDAVAARWRFTSRWTGAVVWVPAFVPAEDTLEDGTPVERPPAVFDFSQWIVRSDWRRDRYAVGIVTYRGMDRWPRRVPAGKDPYLLGTTVGLDVKVDLGGRRTVWLEGTYSAYDQSRDKKTELVVGVDQRWEDGLWVAVQWHRLRDDAREGQEHLMLAVERPTGKAHRLGGTFLYDLKTDAWRAAPRWEYDLSETTTLTVTVAYVDDGRGPLTLPLSNNEMRFQLATRF